LPLGVLLAGGALLGAIFGSFIATLTERWPTGRSPLGRSACEACQTRLRVWDLVPVFSWVFLKGRCHSCRAPIGIRAPLVEFAAALIGLAAFAVAPNLIGLFGAIFGWLLLILVLLDSKHFWLPDAVTFPIIFCGLGFGYWDVSLPYVDRLIGAAGGYLTLELVRQCYKWLRGREGMGGGDPKLFAGIGAWLGWQVLPFVLLMACLTCATGLILSRASGRRIEADQPLAFGAFLAGSAYPFWLFLHWF
jgi:leader peptidase (prepilin peptidase) / N-methyltransferase